MFSLTQNLWHILFLIFFFFAGILEYATLLVLKKYWNFEQSKVAKTQIRKPGSANGIKVLEVNAGNQESDQNQSNFEYFSKRFDKWAFIGCSIYIMLFAIIYMIIALSKWFLTYSRQKCLEDLLENISIRWANTIEPNPSRVAIIFYSLVSWG